MSTTNTTTGQFQETPQQHNARVNAEALTARWRADREARRDRLPKTPAELTKALRAFAKDGLGEMNEDQRDDLRAVEKRHAAERAEFERSAAARAEAVRAAAGVRSQSMKGLAEHMVEREPGDYEALILEHLNRAGTGGSEAWREQIGNGRELLRIGGAPALAAWVADCMQQKPLPWL
ncbi:MAG: hypothetical protein K8S99_12205 [Planctomycetes bacterium]|nr:hypothetical protein [Planctomycetota bacterium]